MSKELLALRKARKAKKPDFVRHKVHTKPRLAKKWRRPAGLQNKLRLRIKGHGSYVSPGYKSPRAVKGLNSEGLQKIIVHNLNDIQNIDAKIQGIVIASKVGNKKRIEIAKKAMEQSISILSMKDAKSFIEQTEEKKSKKKQEKQDKTKKKQEKAKEDEKKAPKKEEKKTHEEKQKEEKELKDAILTSGSE